ncbi:unnamed protein product [Vitrella brassicaformis CCMP3155]|uniref:Uncharacterized protein n=1 Tax=Vitrella brassicaformis (strain CCMP3155) TaxID=1169540 RepID=A0A0G4E891_VITBC|nr:unnamed protein product [Vitrella brassicaformis CCMP3155]|mmetsp:Transcript_31367/g.77728  ORF Transcript_31367/g.77728 Transcript_31367/m.77728 type:complete len:901 (-) Transcript_31367:99-2801(-)|eukprot:CEL91846.1 unnamed protein product [Vitrella brassicaformis CCMP3155]
MTPPIRLLVFVLALAATPTLISSSERSDRLKKVRELIAAAPAQFREAYAPLTDTLHVAITVERFLLSPFRWGEGPIERRYLRATMHGDGTHTRRLADDSKELKEVRKDVCGRADVVIKGKERPGEEGKGTQEEVSKYVDYGLFLDVVMDPEENWEPYIKALAAVLTPVAIGLILLVFVWPVCCYMACCRCCRRCCEPRQRRKRSFLFNLIFLIIFCAFSAGLVVVSFLQVKYNEDLTKGVTNTLCAMAQFAEDSFYGSGEPNTTGYFIGLSNAVDTMESISNQLEPDGVPAEIDRVLNDTLDFEMAKDELDNRLKFMGLVLEQNAPEAIASDHRCVLCDEGPGKITAARDEIKTGVVQALTNVRNEVSDSLTGSTLDDVKDGVESGSKSLKDMKDEMENLIVDSATDSTDLVEDNEKIRYAVFIVLGVIAGLAGILGVLALLYSMFSRTPNPTPVYSCLMYCCFMGITVFAFIFAGLVLFVGVLMAHACTFVREDLQSEKSWNKYFGPGTDVGLDTDTLDIAIQCLTPTGNGSLVEALGIEDDFNFQKDIDAAFADLDESENASFAAVDEIEKTAMALGWVIIPQNPSLNSEPRPWEIPTTGIQKEQTNQTDTDLEPNGPIEGLEELQAEIRSRMGGGTPYFWLESLFVPVPGAPFANPPGTEYRINAGFSLVEPFATNNPTLNSELVGPLAAEPARSEFLALLYWAKQKVQLTGTGNDAWFCPSYTDHIDPTTGELVTDTSSGSETLDSGRGLNPCEYQDTGGLTGIDYYDYLWSRGYNQSLPAADPGISQEVTMAKETLEFEVNEAQRKLGVELRGSIQPVLDMTADLLDGINCKFMLRGLNGMFDGLCGYIVSNMLRVCICWIVAGCFSFCLMIMMYMDWRYNLDNRMVDKDNNKVI